MVRGVAAFPASPLATNRCMPGHHGCASQLAVRCGHSCCPAGPRQDAAHAGHPVEHHHGLLCTVYSTMSSQLHES